MLSAVKDLKVESEIPGYFSALARPREDRRGQEACALEGAEGPKYLNALNCGNVDMAMRLDDTPGPLSLHGP